MGVRGRFACLLAAGLALIAPLSAHAREYYFFNKAGVDRQTYLKDRLVCDELAGGAARRSPDMNVVNNQIWQNPNLTMGQAAAAAGVASFLAGFMAASERRHLSWQIERICMADKGYRRFTMDKKAFQSIQKSADDAARIDQWFALASNNRPEAEEMPE
jgi:hypothetical protein